MGTTTFSGPVRSIDGFIGDVTGNTIGTVASFSGAGAIPVTARTVRLTTTGANALTLANGVNGQMLTIVMVVDGGDGTLAPALETGFTTIVFNDVGDAITLQFFTTLGWMIVSNYGCTVNV